MDHPSGDVARPSSLADFSDRRSPWGQRGACTGRGRESWYSRSKSAHSERDSSARARILLMSHARI